MVTAHQAVRCPLCGREGWPGDRFCEADGAPLVPTTGASEAAAPDVVAPAYDLAAATLRGRTHEVNEDAVAVGRLELEGVPLHALVVCDGVSASSHGEQAAARAARAALATLLAAAAGPGPVDRDVALREAVRAAHRAACVSGIEPTPGEDPSGTTLVAAVAHGGRVDVAWVGDSRAYLLSPALPGGGPAAVVLLTRDHSWMNEVVASGELTAAEAARSPDAHALTRCLGPLEDPDPDRAPEPSLAAVSAVAGSRLIVCSDGLWNGATGAAELAALAAGLPPAVDARSLALDLVHQALVTGARDDVTAAVAFL